MCRWTERCYAERYYAQCRCTGCHYAECCWTECRYIECFSSRKMLPTKVLNLFGLAAIAELLGHSTLMDYGRKIASGFYKASQIDPSLIFFILARLGAGSQSLE